MPWGGFYIPNNSDNNSSINYEIMKTIKQYQTILVKGLPRFTMEYNEATVHLATWIDKPYVCLSSKLNKTKYQTFTEYINTVPCSPSDGNSKMATHN